MVKLRLLGGFDLEDAGQGSVSIATLKGRALLAYLACAKGRAASRDSLALLLWSDSDSRKSRQNLRQVLLKLSRTLARHDLPILRVDAQTVTLRNEDIWVDVWELESLGNAESFPALGRVESLYHGEFLDGLALDAPVFGDWLADMRAHFQNRALNCLYALLEHQRDAGDLRAAITTGARTLEIDSSQEQVHRALMELYLASGMRGAALNQYRICRRVLHRDLDVVPDEATEALRRRIREHTAGLRPGQHGDLGAAPSQQGDDSPDNQWEMPEPPIGRAAESKALHDAYTEACSRGARLFALCGEAGIGKTHLLDAFTTLLDGERIPVCRVAARQADTRRSLGLWRQVLDSLSPSHDSALPQEPDGLREVSAPYGVQHGRAGNLRLWTHESGRGSFDDMLERLRNHVTQGPLVLILEDVQWADADSLHLLGWALHRLQQAPVLFVVAARLPPVTELTHFAPVLRDLERGGLVRHCDLGPLSFDDSMALIDKALAVRGLSKLKNGHLRQLWNVAEGNPEILVAGLSPPARIDAHPLPQNLRHNARQIMDSISPPVKTLVNIVSLGRDPLGLAVCAHAAGMDAASAAAALEELIVAKLLRTVDDRFVIARRWLSKAIHDDLLAHRRRALHAAIATAIREVEASDLVPHYDALAYHCRAAGESVVAAGYRLSALELSLARGARRGVSKALDRLVRSLRERPPDPKIDAVCWRAGFLRAAIAEAEADPASALSHLRALERSGARNDDPHAAVALSYALSRACCVAGDGEEGLRYARRALYLSAGQSGAEGPWQLAERILFRCHLYAPAAQDIVLGLKARARRAGLRRAWSAVSEVVAAQAMMEALSGQVTATKGSFDAARAAVARLREPRSEAGLLQIEGMVRTWVGEAPQALEALSKALALADAAGDLIRTCVTRGLRGHAHFAHGLLKEAKVDLEQAIAEAAALGPVPYLPLYYCWLAEVGSRNGQHDDALKHARHAWRLSQRQGQAWNRAPVLRALARGFAHAGQPNIAASERAVREAIAIERSVGFRVGLADSHVAYAGAGAPQAI